jgi:hypothetical protein
MRTPGFAALAGLAALAALAACRGDAITPAAEASRLSFVVSNALVAPVTLAVDGAPALILSAGRSGTLTVAPTARVTWTAAKPTDASGRPIPDDVGEVRLPVPTASATVEIVNVIDGRPYVTASIFNHTPVAVSIAVWNGAALTCAAPLPAASDSASGFVRIGYYQLQPATEVRAYRGPAGCTGSYSSWPASRLANYAAKSGLVTLTLDAAP